VIYSSGYTCFYLFGDCDELIEAIARVTLVRYLLFTTKRQKGALSNSVN
jgi:hypothetical protein